MSEFERVVDSANNEEWGEQSKQWAKIAGAFVRDAMPPSASEAEKQAAYERMYAKLAVDQLARPSAGGQLETTSTQWVQQATELNIRMREFTVSNEVNARATIDAIRDHTHMQATYAQKRVVQDSVTMDSLARGLSETAQRKLMSYVRQPLSAGGRLPPEQELSDFFERVEEGIELLGEEVAVAMLGPEHLRIVAPLVLGDPVWDLYRKRGYSTWRDLRAAVEDRFGLRPQQVREAFLASRPSEDEDPCSFILRMEDCRCRLAVDGLACWGRFVACLPVEVRAEIDQLNYIAETSGGQQVTEWCDLVRFCRAKQRGTKLAPEVATHASRIAGFGSAQKGAPLDGALAVAYPYGERPAEPAGMQAQMRILPRPQHGVLPRAPPGYGRPTDVDLRNHRPLRQCRVCGPLGISHDHEWERCFANPGSSFFQQRVFQQRLAQYAERGLAPPECLQGLQVGEQQRQPWQQQQHRAERVERTADRVEPPTAPPRVPLPTTSPGQAVSKHEAGALMPALLKALNEEDPTQGVANVLSKWNGHEEPADRPNPAMMFRHCEDERDTVPAPDFVATCMNQDVQKVGVIEKAVDQFVQVVGPEGVRALMESYHEEAVSGLQAAIKGVNLVQDDDVSMSDGEPGNVGESSGRGAEVSTKRSFGVQTGGVKGAGVVLGDRVRRVTPTPDAGTAVSRLKIWLPMARAARMAPNVRDLLLNILIADCFAEGARVEVPEGTKVHPIPMTRFKEHRTLLEDAGLDDQERVNKGKRQLLKQERRKEMAGLKDEQPAKRHAAAQHLLHEVLDVLTTKYGGSVDEEEEEDEDGAPQFSSRVVQSTPLPEGDKVIPEWVTGECTNGRGVVVWSSDQFVVLCQIDQWVGEVIADTAGARSLIDKDTARSLGMHVEVATPHVSFGTFVGPGGKPQPYYGRVQGPFELRFNEKVLLRLGEIKVVDHSEPLILLGADVLCDGRTGWNFECVGVRNGVGYMNFLNGMRESRVTLVNAPRLGVRRHKTGGVPVRPKLTESVLQAHAKGPVEADAGPESPTKVALLVRARLEEVLGKPRDRRVHWADQAPGV